MVINFGLIFVILLKFQEQETHSQHLQTKLDDVKKEMEYFTESIHRSTWKLGKRDERSADDFLSTDDAFDGSVHREQLVLRSSFNSKALRGLLGKSILFMVLSFN